jgi:hypothetical protein
MIIPGGHFPEPRSQRTAAATPGLPASLRYGAPEPHPTHDAFPGPLRPYPNSGG